MDAYYADLVTSIVVPTMLVALLAAAVAIMFFEVFGMGTAVLLQCFIAGGAGLPPSLSPRRGPGLALCVFLSLTARARRRFCTDEELFKDDPENCFAEGDLKKYLNKNGKSRKKKTEKK
jgi:hypothetical protein